jgi:hypothetical protein
MSSSNSSISLWAQAMRQRIVWSRAVIVGLPVGCLQALLNQGDIWWRHQVDSVVLLKTIVSPLVTFSVALISSAATWVERQRSEKSET